jgi:hypothetical protein
MRGYPQRILFSLAAFVALAALAGCPPHPPAPVGPPDASDAAPVVTCPAACANAEKVCPAVLDSVCEPACSRVGATYARCLGVATGCPGVKACDPLAGSGGDPASPHGR